MKRLVLLLAILCVTTIVVAPAAHALGVFGAYWNPRKSDNNGYGGGLRFDSPISPMINVDARISYITFPDGDTNIIPIEATAAVKLGMTYAGVGYGYYFFGGKSDIADDWGWYLLVGVDLLPGPVSVFGEFKWQNLESGSANFESYVFHVGATFSL